MQCPLTKKGPDVDRSDRSALYHDNRGNRHSRRSFGHPQRHLTTAFGEEATLSDGQIEIDAHGSHVRLEDSVEVIDLQRRKYAARLCCSLNQRYTNQRNKSHDSE